MKKITVFVMIFLGMIHYSARAQEDKGFRFTIKTNPLSALGGPLFVAFVPITGEYKVLFEVKTARKQSLETGIGYLGPSVLINLDNLTNSDSVSGLRTMGFRVQATYKFFITKESAPEGFYVGPHLSYAKARLENKDDINQYFEASKTNVDLLFGYQLITSGGFTLNVYTGLGVKFRDYAFSGNSEDTFDFNTGNNVSPAVAFGFAFGYAF
jgi:hypothetical protein